MFFVPVHILIALLLHFIQLCSAASSHDIQRLIRGLQSDGFHGEILVNGEPGFENATLPWSLNYAEDPFIAVLPDAAEDVSLATQWFKRCSMDFAVRSGGAAASQSHDAILNLAHLTTTRYVASLNMIFLGPGNSWGAVYDALKSSPVTPLGGRVPLVGVGGFTIGGGISYLMNRYGLASDSIVDAQVVLANGSVVWAKDDPDLLFAVRGAGFTIGAVTELVVKAYPKPTEIYSGALIYPIDQFGNISDLVGKFSVTNTDPNVSLLLATVPLNGAPVVVLLPTFYGNETFAKTVLSWAWEIPSILDTTGYITWEQLQDIQLQFISHPANTSNYHQHNVVVEKLTSEVMRAAVDWQLNLLSDPRWSGLQVLIEPFIPGAFSSHAKNSSWPHSNPNASIVQLFIEQRNASYGDAEENEDMLRYGATLVEEAADGAVLPRYPNYYLQGEPAVEYYDDNLPLLQAVKRKFDPENRFNKSVQIVV